LHKVEDAANSFWSFKRKPKQLNVGDILWIVKNGAVVGGFYIRKIGFGRRPVKNASGHNPINCWRVWFSGIVPEQELEDMGIIGETGDPLIEVRGFQGFRYQWWVNTKLTELTCERCGFKAKAVPGGWDVVESPNRPKLRLNTYILKPFVVENGKTLCSFCAKELEKQ